MSQRDVELVVRAVARDYGLRSDIRRIVLFRSRWYIELDLDGASKTLTVVDSSPQHLRASVITALDL